MIENLWEYVGRKPPWVKLIGGGIGTIFLAILFMNGISGALLFLGIALIISGIVTFLRKLDCENF